nr:hypothetical protein [Tanacetum cinerariifolium]
VPPPHTGFFMPPKPDLFYIGLEEFTSEPAIETLNAKTSEEVPKVVKKDNVDPIIENWKSDDKDKSVPQPKIEKKTVKPSVTKNRRDLPRDIPLDSVVVLRYEKGVKLRLLVQKLMPLVEVKTAGTKVNAASTKLMMLIIFNAALHGWYYMVFVTTIGEEYDKVCKHLDMLNAPFERKVFTCANQVKPYNLKGEDLLTDLHDSNLYTISISEMELHL